MPSQTFGLHSVIHLEVRTYYLAVIKKRIYKLELKSTLNHKYEHKVRNKNVMQMCACVCLNESSVLLSCTSLFYLSRSVSVFVVACPCSGFSRKPMFFLVDLWSRLGQPDFSLHSSANREREGEEWGWMVSNKNMNNGNTHSALELLVNP